MRYQFSASKLHFVALFLMLTFFSCNNDNKKGEETSTDSPTKQPDSSTSALTAVNDFPLLYISKADLAAIFDPTTVPPGPATQKIVFVFHWTNPSTDNPTLLGYAAKKSGEFISPDKPDTLNKIDLLTLTLPGPINMGNLELSKKNYDALKKLASYTQATDLIFSPIKKSNNSISYKLTWGKAPSITKENMQMLNADDELNPSPPAKPDGVE